MVASALLDFLHYSDYGIFLVTTIYSLISCKNCLFLELHFIDGAAQSLGSMGFGNSHLPGRGPGRKVEFFHCHAPAAFLVVCSTNDLELPSWEPCYRTIREKPLTVFVLSRWIPRVSFMKETWFWVPDTVSQARPRGPPKLPLQSSLYYFLIPCLWVLFCK